MALSFFGGGGHASRAKYFDIRLDDDYVVFRGSEDEAASALLKGNVVLCLSEPLTIKNIKLHLTGMSRVCWHLPSTTAGGGRRHWREKVFYEKTWKFKDAGKGKTEVLPAGNYEFPFEIILEGSLSETVEGLPDNWVIYRFKAEIGRKYAKDIIVRKPLRIIRTLESTALELSHAMSVENIWPEKIEYAINTPTKAVIFGTTIQVDFRLIPLLKGLRIGQIFSELIECDELTLNPEDHGSLRNTYTTTRSIVSDVYELPEDAPVEILNDVAEGYQLSRYLSLPKSLTKCLQDTDTRGIRVRHKLKFRIQLHNPDGHVSELRATLPVSIFISPSLAIDENNNLIDQTPESAVRAVEEYAQQAPPLYGEHLFDQLYSDVDLTGYRTPGYRTPGPPTGLTSWPASRPPSGPGTPMGSLSRNLSSENISSMNAVTDTDISASVLHSRLARLHASRNRNPPSPGEHPDGRPDGRLNVTQDYFTYSGASSHGATSPDPSRRPSDDLDHDPVLSGMGTPYWPQYAEVETLSRVPSYSTAVRSSVKPREPGLPDYNSVIASDTPPLPESPQQVHLRSGHRSPSHFSPVEMHQRLDSLHPRRSHRSADDEERSLRLLQARARG
ncbi:hypothetical protein MPDQ_000072 [Monascus purpureus]|uniref:Carbon catabolite repressor D n=1 Tax=Monascus purpureus TaxID=5098 RepID=A0A507R6U2_MONPU|nr:hypothetical protein MPDQ_000072 [Monascus purpureus]